MDLELAGKTAVVLAASQGLGLGVAERLAEEGANVVIAGRTEARLVAAAAAINARGKGQAAFVVADLAKPDATTHILARAREAFGEVDVLVNNSGGPPPRPASNVTNEDWSAQFNQMLLPLFDITRQVLVGMRARRFGRIVTIASSGILQPIPNLAISNALRSSLVGFMKTLSSEVAADGVTVNIVAPGRIATARVAELDQAAADKTGTSLDDVARASMATIPAGRYGRVDEFASVVAFLCGAPASYVTGSIIRVDGGMIRSV